MTDVTGYRAEPVGKLALLRPVVKVDGVPTVAPLWADGVAAYLVRPGSRALAPVSDEDLRGEGER